MATSPSYNQDTAALFPSTQGEVSRSTEGPSASEWEARKEDIRRLYEKKPLKDVKAHLEKHYGFRATERMFKSRLHQWKFTKNSSDKEYQICAVLHKTRKDKGKFDSAFVINGNPRSLRDLRKYIKGRKMTEDEFLDAALESVNISKLDDKVRAVTPEPEPESEEVGEPQDSDDSDAPTQPSRYAKLTPSSSNASSSPHQSSALHRDALAASRQIATSGASSSFNHGKRRSSQTSHRHYSSASSVSNLAGHGIAQIPSAPAFTPDTYSTSPTSVTRHQTGRLSQRSSPRRSFDRSDIDSLAYSTLYSASLPQTYGTDNLDAWAAMMNVDGSDTSSLSDYDVVCPKCHRLTSDHFTSLCNLGTPDSGVYSPSSQSNADMTRDIFNPSPDLPAAANHFAIPAPTKQHDHSWKWVSHCFSACIYYSRSRYTTTSDNNLTQHTPVATSAPNDFAFARWDLERASHEFHAMLSKGDPNVLIALNQTVMVLSMHNWGNITPTILSSATKGTEQALGSSHPINILIRFIIRMSSGNTMYANDQITSPTLKGVWQAFVHGWTSEDGQRIIHAEGEAGRRAIPAMYCFASLLCAEAVNEHNPAKRAVMLAECEYTLKNCYQLACATFQKKHLQTVQVMVKLQLCLERQERIPEAIEWTERAVRDGEETLGKWHPRQLETKRILAELYRRDARHGQAVEDIYWDVLEGRIRMLGKKHESTMAIKQTLEQFLKDRGRWETDGGSSKTSSAAKDRMNDLWEWTHLDREDGGDGAPGDHVQEGY
ncbi:uncharacterized protein HMPREF1541_01157 [Cyphellophora europaea CBS 101466]|uniref:Clr5 domain-containing protein n=1 Tax=Cyphellophora europaea (strain CBS 101466) TaxID=1220924 RepID=W2SE55_CYPE1|nr:uncharacterized protein HMPREF1541_01157 [Cyphellophora europaea CBS 101466]ETN46967.1 hypothetical protein HMPREF1541_01157 [Cyphellophora europaea CBS 101466]